MFSPIFVSSVLNKLTSIVTGTLFDPLNALGTYNSLNKTVITEFQSGHGFNTNAGGSHDYNSTTEPIIGTQHFELTTDGAQGYKYCQNVPLPQSYDLTGKNLAILLKIDDVANLDEFQIILGNNGGFSTGEFIRYSNLEGSQAVNWFSDNEWALFVLPLNTDNNNPTFDFTDVSAIRIAFRDKATSAINVLVQAIAIVDIPSSPKASIIFDDAHESVGNLAFGVMAGLGIVGSIAAPHDVLGTGSYMSVAQLKTLQDDNGWEIVGHATGNNQTADTEATVAAYLAASKAFWPANGIFTQGWVYAGGEYGPVSDNPNIRVRDLVQASGFTWARTINEKLPESIPPGDPFKLRVVYVTSSDTAASVISAIDLAIAAGMWPIIVFHRIVSGIPTINTEYNLGDFTTIMNHLDTSGIVVDTPSNVLLA